MLFSLALYLAGALPVQAAFPGETDPIGAQPSRLTQLPDDELAFVSSAPDDTQYWIQEFSPNPDYSLPAGPTSDPLDYEPNASQLTGPPNGYQHLFNIAKGRIVDPTRDVAVTLSKVGFDASTSTLTWALQEMSFSDNGNTPRTVPAITFAAPVVPGQAMAVDSPGALAVGDLDKAIDAQGHYHDEVVLAYETYQSGPNTDVLLSVLDYSAPGVTFQPAFLIGLPGGPFAYPCNISWLFGSGGGSPPPCGLRHPGTINVAVGDLDGDGFKEIALVALTYDGRTNFNNLQAYLYSYCPGSLSAGDPRSPYCPLGAVHASLQLRGFTTIDGGPDAAAKGYFENPVDVAVGDLDGDGDDDLAVVHLTNQRYIFEALEDDKYLGDTTLSLLAWTGSGASSAETLQVVSTTFVSTVDAWYDGLGDSSDAPIHYHDIRVATGLFKFSPDLGYDLGRRQLAITQAPSKERLQVGLWDVSSPSSPGTNPPQAWTARRYASSSLIDYCGDSYASFSLQAGNWAGVKADPPNPLWGLAVGFEDKTAVRANLYRVDQNVDPQTAEGPLTLASTQAAPKEGASSGCGHTSRNDLIAYDYDGDALQLGAPMHIVLQIPQVFDYILQEPPQHLDYFPNSGWANISRRTDFNVSYGTTQTDSFSTMTDKSTSWSVGTTIAGNATFGVDGTLGIFGAKGSVSVSDKFSYDYNANQHNYVGSADSYASALATQTAGGDSLQFRAKVVDIWRYPVYGEPPLDPSRPFNYYELYLPRTNKTPQENMDDLQAQAYGYQPIHENGNALSYPAIPVGEAYTPADLGPWLLPASTTSPPPGAEPCENNTRWCITVPVSENDHQFNWGRDSGSLSLAIDHSQTKGSSRDWTSKFADSLDVEASIKASAFGTTATACVNVQVHGAGSWGKSSTSASTSAETTDLTINVPSTQDLSTPYHFNPVMYVTGDGTIKVAHSTGTDNGGIFWTNNYTGPDPALSLPRKFNFPTGATAWEINKDWIDAQRIRGFYVRSTKPNPITGTFDVVDGAKAGEPVLIEARVYNYSVGTSLQSVDVQFGLEPVDPSNNHVATGPREILDVVPSDPIPHHGALDSQSMVEQNFVPVSYSLDTSKLLPPGVNKQTYRVWVVLDPAGNPTETHGWRERSVILTPQKTLAAGTAVTLEIQDKSGSVLDTVSYISQGTDDNIAAGLASAINMSPAVKDFGVSVSVQDARTTAPSIVVFKPGAEAPAASEYRAGLVSGGQQIYFVPPAVPPNGVPLVTATNLEYGQNDEGWGLLTVYHSAVPGPALGADDPCAISASYSAMKGPDISLSKQSLAMALSGRSELYRRLTRVRPGQRVKLRISAFSPIHWSGFERVTLFQGHPDKRGKVVGAVEIHGIDKTDGGHAWITWIAPAKPGAYKLVARLQERWNDERLGNNIAQLRVIVRPKRRITNNR